MRSMSYPIISRDGSVFDGGDGRLYAVPYNDSDVYRIDGNKLRWAFKLPKGCVYDHYGSVGYDYILARVPDEYGGSRAWKLCIVSSEQVYRFHNSGHFVSCGFNAKHKILVTYLASMRIGCINLQTMDESITTHDLAARANVDQLLIADYRNGMIQTRYLTAPDDIVSTIDIKDLHLCEPIFYYPIAPNIIALLGSVKENEENQLFIVRNDRIAFQLPMRDVIRAASMKNRFIIRGLLATDRRPRLGFLYGNLDNNRFCILTDIFNARLLRRGVAVTLPNAGEYFIVPSKHLERKAFNIVKFDSNCSSSLATV